MSLKDHLAEARRDIDEHDPRRRQHPEGWEPGLTYDEATNEGHITTGPLDEPPSDWGPLIEYFGFPADRFEIIPGTVKVSAWQGWKRENQGEQAVSTIQHSYRAGIRQKRPGVDPDYEALREEIRRHKPKKSKGPDGPAAMIVALADWQLGKRDGDGTEGIVHRALMLGDKVEQRVKTLRRVGVNPGTLYVAGMGDIVEGCSGHYCVTTDTPVLTDGLRWVPVGTLEPGDTLYSISEKPAGPRGYRYEKAEVIHNDLEDADVVRVIFDNGESITCTPEHPLLAAHRRDTGGQTKYEWVAASDLQPGYHDVPKLFDVWEDGTTFDHGWLSGMYDGEGSLSAGADRSAPNILGISQKAGPVMDRICLLLARFGVPFSKSDTRVSGVEVVRVRGGQRSILRLLGMIRPTRLLEKVGYPYMRANEWARVVAVVPAGRRKVAKLGTSSHTYIANGYPSHNSMQSFQVELDRREQVTVARRLIVKLLRQWAPLFDKVVVLAVPGNHGEHRQDGKAFTNFGDNDDTAVFEQVCEILSESDAFKHVSWVIPKNELTVTLDCAGTVVGFAHGHQATRGANIAAKIEAWWKGQQHGRHPIGDADVLITAHYHHFAAKTDAGRTWLQCPTLDGGSTWFEHQSGARTMPGTLSVVVGRGGWNHLEIL